MGTNFYTVKDNEHIGKRSAAGWYCWDCRRTLCARGEKFVHHGVRNMAEADRIRREHSRHEVDDHGYFTHCPECEKERPDGKDLLIKGAAARELGFDKSLFAPRTGVDTCSSFSWAMDPNGEVYKKLVTKRGKPIVDEYGTRYSIKKWLAMLEECPLRYFHIGENFS